MKFGRLLTSSLALAAAITVGTMSAPPAKAAAIGLLILEGSDSQTFHGLDPYSTNFLNGMATFSTNSTLPIGYYNANPIGTPTVGKALISVLPDFATMLASYSGIYLASPGGCCDQTSLTPTEAADIRLFLEAGRSVAIEDYQGGAQFDVIIGNTGAFAGQANQFVDGHGGGTDNLGSCFDNNIVAPGGAALFGVPVGSAVPNVGCFGHQVYQAAFFDTLGLTTYIATNPALTGYNVVISNGGGGLIEVLQTPEPVSMALLGTGIIGLGFARRRRA